MATRDSLTEVEALECGKHWGGVEGRQCKEKAESDWVLGGLMGRQETRQGRQRKMIHDFRIFDSEAPPSPLVLPHVC